jgi:hypothetical protein
VGCWMRNLDSRPETSFWLQTSTDRFYPDFVARLRDGRIFVVEYKGEDRWGNDDSKEKRALGELWAERSGGQCLFVMPKGFRCKSDVWRKSARSRSVARIGRIVVALRGDEGSGGSARTDFEGPVRRAEPSGQAGLRVLRPVQKG